MVCWSGAHQVGSFPGGGGSHCHQKIASDLARAPSSLTRAHRLEKGLKQKLYSRESSLASLGAGGRANRVLQSAKARVGGGDTPTTLYVYKRVLARVHLERARFSRLVDTSPKDFMGSACSSPEKPGKVRGPGVDLLQASTQRSSSQVSRLGSTCLCGLCLVLQTTELCSVR